MQHKRLTGEDFDQKLFRSLARIGSSLNLPSRSGGINLPNIGGKPNKPGRGKPGRGSRMDWPSDSEIADMVDRNGDGFVGDGEPWMTRVRRRARVLSVSRRSSSGNERMDAPSVAESFTRLDRMASGKKRKKPRQKPTSRPNVVPNNETADTETNIFSSFNNPVLEVAAAIKKKYPVRKRMKPKAEDIDLAKSVVKVGTKERVEDGLTEDNILQMLRYEFLEKAQGDPNLVPQIMDDDILRETARQLGELEKRKADEVNIIDNLTADIGPESDEIIYDAVASAISESKPMRSLIERFGWPETTFLYKTPPAEFASDYPDYTPEEINIAVGGFHNGYFNFMALSSDLMKWWYGKQSLDASIPDEEVIRVAEDQDSPGGGNIANNITGIVRHEYGHYLDLHLLMFGTDDQKTAIATLRDWFDNAIPMLKDMRSEGNIFIKKRMEEEGLPLDAFDSNDPAIIEKLSKIHDEFSRLMDLINQFTWMSEYSQSSSAEFIAELFTMATSPDPKVRESIPQNFRAVIEQWLDMKIF